MPASRSVVSVLLRSWETFLYALKAGPAGGLRPPSGPAATRRSPRNRPHPTGSEDDRFGAFSALHWRS
jgi:hypothetical protein